METAEGGIETSGLGNTFHYRGDNAYKLSHVIVRNVDSQGCIYYAKRK